MTQLALQATSLSKFYQIGPTAGKYDYRTIRETISGVAVAPFRNLARALPSVMPCARAGHGALGPPTPVTGLFPALDAVTFEVRPGEVVGLIGRNGAGKSTLLKILTRITTPSAGRAQLWGRASSLLEVGTGFHPELTGKENIYLNGAILGMSRSEISRKFEEIVEFAEVQRFLDVPVKRYSTGMYLRLAFAVAAHLESEILLVDEVLAVGDFDFQRKCMGKMEAVGRSGKTILFVSHHLPAILRLCTRAIVLDRGRLVADGPSHSVCRSYMRSTLNTTAARRWTDPSTAPGDHMARLHAVRLLSEARTVAETVDIRRPLTIEILYWNHSCDGRPVTTLHFFNEDGVCLFTTADTAGQPWLTADRQPGLVRAVCLVPGNFFAEGQIYVDVRITSFNPTLNHVVERSVVCFNVVDPGEGDSVRGEYVHDWPGVLRPNLQWDVQMEAPVTVPA
jgi:homopolymeric O-antigen transport system ATP-binding protein